jgi:hypothetical protein
MSNNEAERYVEMILKDIAFPSGLAYNKVRSKSLQHITDLLGGGFSGNRILNAVRRLRGALTEDYGVIKNE